jgi:hypothetical protein
MIRSVLPHVLYMTTILAVAAGTAKADIINFEAQGAGAPSAFNGTLNSPLKIGIATFNGGQLLNNEAGSVDETAVYASTNTNPVGGAYTDPLTIAFSQAVSSFSIDVTNEFADSYTVADNRGGSQTKALALNTTQSFSLADSGITSVTIGSATKSFWDFAIDNVQFTPAVAPVPEPSGLLLLASVCGAFATLAMRKLL